MATNKPQGFGWGIPPLPIHVQIYFDQQGMTEQEAADFIKHYEANNWTYAGGQPIRDWKEEANKWIWEILSAQNWRRIKPTDFNKI
ncbi:hypothetical protein BDD43_3105 [Mucilaginibacter gracilis]|uniref:Uncharacterized protein n=1 Tax=Mucilaginibacter gracilis TaxID=423350 RepID=A0A495J2Q3_9SPHI|nr:hypothetical protein [Mucilaginibacter gracilis]RKR82912.1 hypothetical protein BDD43_3105 [Mucilaginibacter gracilis]